MNDASPGMLERMDTFTVGQVAERYGVTVRTLHHYDHIGLLTPRGRAANGYRLYTVEDLNRLHHVVLYRRLGLPLAEITTLLDDVGDDPAAIRDLLQRQREALLADIRDKHEMLAAIDTTLEVTMSNRPATDHEIRAIFGSDAAFDDQYRDEAQQRWGHTDAWAQSEERQKKYTPAQWQQIKDEAESSNARLVEVFRSGVAATSVEAMDVAEEQRAHMNQWFYDCSHEMHTTLADMYVADPRFTAYYEGQAEGLTAWYRDAIHANAARHAG